ncbi:YqgQ family protein [Chryseomicrobium palamuruense]|uniref:YqgQ family protein n=1 Tax=Chryseomicrobium palamuruense TaxID=682973 RepID=A0ABV8V0H2_9BACL
MDTFYDVLQLLKRYGIFIYTKDAVADIELMEFELNELKTSGVIDANDYLKAILILRKRKSEFTKNN